MPNEKRARHKAARQARVTELRRAQQRRRNLRRGGVVGVFVVIALVLAALTSLGGGKKASHVATGATTTTGRTTSTTTTSTTTPTATSTTVPGTGVAPLAASKLDSYLVARKPPAKSASCTNSSSPSTSTSTTTIPAKGNAVSIVPAPANVGFPNLNGSSPRYTKFSAAPPFCINVADTYTATMVTSAGTIKIQLLPKYAPQTVNNFVFLAGYHYFDGTVFHRVIPDFVDQGGDPLGTGAGGPGYTIADENPKSASAYDAGSVAMANTGQPHSGGSQFFLVVGNGGKQLSASYAVFGQITAGLAVADKINAGGDAADNGSPPKITYKIERVTITASPAS